MSVPEVNPDVSDQDARRGVMSTCAAATLAELTLVLESLPERVRAVDLRPPKVGLVMLRGRMGGDGAAFNLGEATVARATVQLASGTIGTAYHLGRDLKKARQAAIVDAVWQEMPWRPHLESAMAPIHARLRQEAEIQARQTAATRVQFFTMVRGDN